MFIRDIDEDTAEALFMVAQSKDGIELTDGHMVFAFSTAIAPPPSPPGYRFKGMRTTRDGLLTEYEPCIPRLVVNWGRFRS